MVDEFYDWAETVLRIVSPGNVLSLRGDAWLDVWTGDASMFDLKPISVESLPRALSKAERYRLLNEPRCAESICRDILRVDETHQEAVVLLILSMADQFGCDMRVNVNHVEEDVKRITDDYARAYYAGVVYERWAKAQLKEGTPGYVVYEWFERAMHNFALAEAMSPAGNDDAILRWNTCARIVKRNHEIRPRAEERNTADFPDEVPLR